VGLKSRINYWRRIFAVYLGIGPSHLTFWHGLPQINKKASFDKLGQYYMLFKYKADYIGPFDKDGIPLLDYKGVIGKQYNPIAIAQYGLGHYNSGNLEVAKRQAEWLIDNQEKNGLWAHHFDWEYRDKLKAPWYSALAQGNGISLLLRIYLVTKNKNYFESAQKAFQSLLTPIKKGGVLWVDKNNDFWLEEAIVSPPTHILNGFLWTLFGVWDYYLLTKNKEARDLFDKCIKTLKNNLEKFDIGFWSLYEQSGTGMKMLASPFYHELHIVQLSILHKMTREQIFKNYAEKWEKYQLNWLFRNLALIYKIIFKIFYY